MMTEARATIRETLAQLRSQLDDLESMDPSVVDRITADLRDIEDAMREGRDRVAPASLTERLTDVAVQFEDSHPTFSGALTRLVDILGQMGI